MQTREAVTLAGERQLPLTEAQKELWLLTQLEARASIAYNVCYAIELRGELSVVTLRAALQAVVDRHDALRAHVHAEGELLVIADGFEVELPLDDLARLSADEQRERLRAEAAREFDLGAGPLLRARLFKTGMQAHVLLLASHHIVVDGASMATLFRELGELYSAALEIRAPRLPAPVRYAEHVEQQQSSRATPSWQAAEEYWIERFRQPVPPVDLPADRARPGARTFGGGLESLLIEPSLGAQLEALGNAHGCTLFMTLFTAFAGLVRRLTAQDDLVIGINVSGRSGRRSQGLVGYLTRLLPIRVAVPADARVAELLPQVRETLLEALERREYTLGDVIRRLNPVRAPGRSPLVDLTFNFERDAERFQFTGLEAGLLPLPLTAAKYDLDFNVFQTSRGLRCDVEYNTDLFEPETVAGFLGLWRNLLAAMVAEPQARLRDLPWLDESQREQLVTGWNRTDREVLPATLTEAVEEQARRTPLATALASGGAELSYAELNSRANRLARHLARAGVGREVRVGVCLERGLDWVVAILAVWKAGGVYVALDPAYPRERLAFMLDDASAAVLVTVAALQAELPGHGARVVCLDGDGEAIARCSEADTGWRSGPHDLAYVMYTSGSTGRPKGAMIEQRGLMNHLWSKVHDLGLSPRDVLAQNAPASFDVSVWQVFAVLLVGGRVEIIAEDAARDADQLLGEAQRLRVSVLETVPALLAAMVEQQQERGAERLDLRDLRWMISNAEALPAGLCRRFAALYPRVGLINAYGPTECSDDVTHLRVDEPRLRGLKYAPLGDRVQNMRLYVVDEDLRPVPPGVAGEMCIGGIGVGRGYLGRPELTAARYVPDPFSPWPGARLYRTGDKVRLLRNGTFEFLGRFDHQVKLRGLRLELPEIEAVLGQHETVMQSAVIVREGDPGDRRLVGYVVAKPHAAVDVGALRAYLKQRLPDYMVPAAIVVLERMPLSANEKIDRQALPRPEGGRPELEQPFRAPRGLVEETLAAIWSELLHVDEIGIDDDFFELGGHSLLATQVVSRVRRRLQVDLPLRRLFEAPTVASLARAVQELCSAGGAAEEPAPVERVSREQPLQLSYAQQRLWFLQEFETDPALYNMLSVLRLRGKLQVPVLERAVGEIVRRHEVLRTCFVEQQGVPVQVVQPARPVVLPVLDLQASAGAGQQREIERHIEDDVRRPFDLTRGPLLRGRLLRLGPQEHVYLLGMHHIVGDGWSLEVFVHELVALYDAFLRDQPSPLPELPFQYADYAAWQRRWLHGDVMQRQLAYWTEQLRGMPPALELPTTGPRPASPSHRGRQLTFKLSAELTSALQALSRRHGVTLFVTLLAAFQALLSRYSGQTDVVVGGPGGGRSRGETEGLIGFFVNALVLRTDFSDRPAFAELVQRVREIVLNAYANQDVPFDRLVEELQPQRDMSRTPLFQVGFDLQRRLSLASDTLTFTEEGFEFPFEKFDLSLRMVDVPGGLEGLMLYQTDLFDEAAIVGLARHFEVLLRGIVAAPPERRIDEIELLTGAEREQVLEVWNRTGREYPRERGIHELFEAQAARTPDALAVVHGGRRLTYGELDRRANRLAHHLRARGVGPEVLVGLCFDRGLDLVIGQLAILKAGGAYVPLDPGYPTERLAYMVDDAGAGFVLTEEAFQGRFWDVAAEAVCVEAIRGDLARLGTEPLPATSGGAGLAYVMYTSGSTGTPKGIMVSHRAIARLVVNTDYVELGPDDRVAQVSNTSFDAATFEIWGALLNGAALAIIDKDIAISPADLGRALERERVTAMFLTTALFNQAAREAKGLFKGLRYLLFGGEAVDPRWVRDVLQAGAPQQLLHVYGPTETTTFATSFRVRDVEAGAPTVPIGHPIANTRVYVLDRGLRLVPPGVPGEIYIGGPGVARGYWRQPGLTAERFVPDPFDSEGGQRLYRTGDKARCRHDGALEFLGRVDEQIKLRGYRIEVGEIEASLKQDDAVKDAVVLVRDEGGERRLVAYVVGRPGVEVGINALKESLKGRLPEYMVPAALVVLPELPLNANGKVDRQALPAPAREDRDLLEYVAPRTELESALCRIWEETLHVDRVGISDDFFELGGHSLLATRLVSRVRSDLGAEVGLRVLFEWPTVEGLAERVAEELAKGVAQAPAIVAVERRADLPLSYAQRRLWFIHQLQPRSVAYNAPLHLRLTGELDRARLEWCLTEIVRRHEVLRTTFPAREGEPVQAIHPPGPVAVPLVDLSALPERVRHELARRLRQHDAERLFDLARGPLLRATLLRLAPREHQLLLGMHHIVTDGWSAPIFVQELFALWNAASEGRPSPLPEPTLQYADYAVWQQEWLQREVLEKQLPYWREQLQHVSVLDLPTDHPRPPVTSHPGAELFFVLDSESGERLGDWSQREGVTPFMTLLAAFQWLLSRYAMQDDVAVGTVIANRNRQEVEGLVGFFVNTLVLRTEVGGAPSLRELVRRVREVATGAYTHQDMPFEKLVEELNPERDLRRSPLFQVRFTLDNQAPPFPPAAGLQVEEFYVELPEVKFDLTMALERSLAGTVKGYLIYAADLFERRTVERLVEQYRRLVARALAEPDRSLASIDLLADEERALVLAGAGRADPGAAPRRGVPELFEEQARLAPHAPAVTYEGASLSYAELDGRANQLARHLRAMGVGPEVRVGICLGRGLDLVTALLGVLKAGGAYVPIDPANPGDRLAFLFQDARFPVLLTQERLRAHLPAQWIQTVCLDSDWPAIAAHDTDALEPTAQPASLAYVIYTSGSTGAPKAVGIEHRQLAHYVEAAAREMACEPGWRFAFLSNVAADLGHTVLFTSLCRGGTLHVMSEERALDGTRLGAYFREQAIDCAKITPSHLAGLAATADLMPARLLVLGGEACTWSWVEELRARRPGCRIMNHYGPTECTVGAVACQLESAAARAADNVPLGQPLGHARVYLLDGSLQPLPPGMAGELYIGGAGVGRGYLEQPGLTAERFVPDPFGGVPGGRLYRTGDKGRWRSDGALEFLGRVDHQVKIRGFRVELGEIEALLRQHPEVGQAAVVLREDGGQKRLVAYVSRRHAPAALAAPAAQHDPALREHLREHLRARLPEYMVPSVVLVLPALPLTASGKIARRALPVVEPGADGARAFDPPRNELETLLCGIWSDVLGVARVGVRDNFFELGGHSLLGTQVVSRIELALGVEVPLAAIFTAPTVEAFALEVQAAREGQAPAPAPRLVRLNRDGFVDPQAVGPGVRP